MDKQEEIEGMADLIRHNKHVRSDEQVACILFDDGYRKADKVSKEVATELFELVYQFCKENFQSEFLGWGPQLSAAAKAKNDAMNELYSRMKTAVQKYGVEVKQP